MHHYLTKILPIAALLCLTAASAQEYKYTNTATGRDIHVTVLTPNIVKVVNTAGGMEEPANQVVLDVPARGDTSDIRVNITADGVLTLTDLHTGLTLTDNGIRERDGEKSIIKIATEGHGSYYGGGERGHTVNLRGDTLINYNQQNYGYTGNDPRTRQMNITMPLILSSDGYALLFDDFAASTMIMGDTITYTTEAPKPVTYYYVGGVETMAEMTEQLTLLTGRQPLPPLWALGYINSKYGYKTPEETLAVVDSLKSMGYPLDATVLDLYWFGREEDMGILDWDTSVWLDPAGLMQQLKERGVKLITVSEPYVLTNGRAADTYTALSADSLFVRTAEGGTHPVTIWVGEGGMFDVSNPATRKWLSDRYKKLTDLGIGGWWGDLGEPEVHPETGMHANGLTARQYHNRYGNDWASIIRELYEREYPDTRLVTLMRGGTTGLQRECVYPWSTDVSRSWGGLEPQVRIMLNAGLCGLGYMSSDLGGFAVDPENPYQPELYMRWLEMGLFTPIFRTHAQQYAEPFNYPDYADALLELAKERYRMLPYNYTLAYENAATGRPLARPIAFHDRLTARYDSASNDQYMWGRDIIVAPILSAGTTSRRVIFPGGDDWYSPDGNTSYRGNSESVVASEENKPLAFYRAGSIIPRAEYEMENTGDYRQDRYTLHLYPGSAGSCNIYQDDLTSTNTIANGEYRLLEVRRTTDDRGTRLSFDSDGNFEEAPLLIHFDVVLLGIDGPYRVEADGKPIAGTYDPARSTLSFTIDYSPLLHTDVYIHR